jgi:hypothetical protein
MYVYDRWEYSEKIINFVMALITGRIGRVNPKGSAGCRGRRAIKKEDIWGFGATETDADYAAALILTAHFIDYLPKETEGPEFLEG